MISLNASGKSVDSAAGVLAEHFKMPAVVLSPSEGRFSWDFRAVGDTTMALRSVRFVGTLEATLDSGTEFVVQWCRDGRVAFESTRTSIQTQTNIPVVSPNGRSEMRTRMTDASLNLIHIDRSAVENVAEELDAVHFVTFDVVTPISSAALTTWRKAVELVTTVILDTSHPSTSLLKREVSRMIAIAMLTTFPFQSIPRAPIASGVEPAGVRAAYEFVHHHAHQPIGTVDIAHATGLNVRALRTALHRYRNITPTALIHTVRLELIHAELLAADPKHTSVANIAKEWGFIHLGRFAASYRLMHGETPHQTLNHTATTMR